MMGARRGRFWGAWPEGKYRPEKGANGCQAESGRDAALRRPFPAELPVKKLRCALLILSGQKRLDA
jgi:hypothetical protein